MITNNYSPAWAASPGAADVAAAHAYDILHNRMFTDPVLLGRYPDLTAFGLGDGLGDGPAGYPVTAFGWPVVPDALTELLSLLAGRYGRALPPLYITENGCSSDDQPGAEGVVDDQFRIGFLDGHLRAVHAAVSAGIDVRGYFCWTLLDNFEWSEGYHQRFGLVHVDHATQARTPKASYGWYRDLITAQRAP